MYDEDDNIWWRIACGHHQNLYEAAVERYQTAEAQVQRVREVCVEGPHQTCMVCATWKTWADGRTDLLGEPWPCSTIRILDGGSDE